MDVYPESNRHLMRYGYILTCSIVFYSMYIRSLQKSHILCVRSLDSKVRESVPALKENILCASVMECTDPVGETSVCRADNLLLYNWVPLFSFHACTAIYESYLSSRQLFLV
jgi:hypothetical protein